jgi:hypothetical protein
MLNRLENRFNKLSIKSIIEIFLILFIMFILLVLYIRSIDFYPIKKIKANYINGSAYEIYSKIKEFENINIISSKIQNKSIHLELISNLENIIYYINKIENLNNFLKIDDYKVTKKDENYKLMVKVSLDKYKAKKSDFLVEYKSQNNFIKEKTTNIKTFNINKSENFTLSAIVFNSVILNDKYLKINELINGYRLIKIRDKSVILSKNNKTIEVYFYE